MIGWRLVGRQGERITAEIRMRWHLDCWEPQALQWGHAWSVWGRGAGFWRDTCRQGHPSPAASERQPLPAGCLPDTYLDVSMRMSDKNMPPLELLVLFPASSPPSRLLGAPASKLGGFLGVSFLHIPHVQSIMSPVKATSRKAPESVHSFLSPLTPTPGRSGHRVVLDSCGSLPPGHSPPPASEASSKNSDWAVDTSC